MRSTLVTRLMHLYFLVRRPMTLGIRAAAFDEAGRVFLVRHTYVPGWHLPGGGVERRETVRQTLEKELSEEGNLVLTEEPELVAVYFNKRTSRRDHVVFYRCANVQQSAPKMADAEIREAGFFRPDALPEDTTPATRQRLAELAGERACSAFW